MAENSAIEWTDHTWSPVWGCTEVSKAETGGGGCDNCYARTLAHRFGYGWNGAPMREFGEHHWNEPLRWNRRAERDGTRPRVFPSMCDPFDKNWPEGVRERFIRLILDTPNLTWLLLTKRIGNVSKMLDRDQWEHLGNVWLGATVVNQEEADRDIPKLLAVPARVRFLSIEPMLGPVDLTRIEIGGGDFEIFPLTGTTGCTNYDGEPIPDIPALSWIIAGGESGPHARPAHPDWFRSLRDACAAAGAPFMFKQWGEWLHNDQGADMLGTELSPLHQWGRPRTNDFSVRVGKKAAGRLLDGVEHNGFPVGGGEDGRG